MSQIKKFVLAAVAGTVITLAAGAPAYALEDIKPLRAGLEDIKPLKTGLEDIKPLKTGLEDIKPLKF